ncbi:MAG: hypothetical protein M0Q51_01285 [Bacteroidales bacterium]|nr:hypothetical protein [Bacteroidales bacterium]
MKPDFYTKAVLTVIAICLLIIVFKQMEIIPTSFANFPSTNLSSNMNFGLVPLNSDGSIDVNIKSMSDIIDVNIEEVGGYSCYDKVPISIEAIGDYDCYNKIPVVIKENQDK